MSDATRENALLPCPFCGRDSDVAMSIGGPSYLVRCFFCGAHGPTCQTKPLAGDSWNRRAETRGADVQTDGRMLQLTWLLAAMVSQYHDDDATRLLAAHVTARGTPPGFDGDARVDDLIRDALRTADDEWPVRFGTPGVPAAPRTEIARMSPSDFGNLLFEKWRTEYPATVPYRRMISDVVALLHDHA